MSKKDISKIIKEGSYKQRLRLLAEHYSDLVTGGKGLFTEAEAREIIESFKTRTEIKAYNKTIETDRRMRSAILQMAVYGVSYREAMGYLSGYSLLWESYQRTEELLNNLLTEVTDKKLKAKLIKETTDNTRYLFTKIQEEEGFIRFRTDKARNPNKDEIYSLEEMLGLWSKQVAKLIGQIKGVIKALEDWMEERDFKPKAYIERIESIKQDIEEDKSILPKYSERKIMASGLFREKDKKIKLLKKYFVFPDPNKIEPNEETYRNFRRDHLDYE